MNATIDEKKEVLKKLVKDGEIIMLFDSSRDFFRPVWLAEWTAQLETCDKTEIASLFKKTVHIMQQKRT